MKVSQGQMWIVSRQGRSQSGSCTGWSGPLLPTYAQKTHLHMGRLISMQQIRPELTFTKTMAEYINKLLTIYHQSRSISPFSPDGSALSFPSPDAFAASSVFPSSFFSSLGGSSFGLGFGLVIIGLQVFSSAYKEDNQWATCGIMCLQMCTSKDSNQPGHSHSLIRDFAGCPKKWVPSNDRSDCLIVQADLQLHWEHILRNIFSCYSWY